MHQWIWRRPFVTISDRTQKMLNIFSEQLQINKWPIVHKTVYLNRLESKQYEFEYVGKNYALSQIILLKTLLTCGEKLSKWATLIWATLIVSLIPFYSMNCFNLN